MAGSVEKTTSRLGKTTNLGVLVDFVGEPYQEGVLAGVLQASKAAQSNLFCFVGAGLSRDGELDARNRIYDLVDRNQVDGLIVLTSTLMHQVGAKGVENYVKERFPNLPLVSVGANLASISRHHVKAKIAVVTARNFLGQRDLRRVLGSGGQTAPFPPQPHSSCLRVIPTWEGRLAFAASTVARTEADAPGVRSAIVVAKVFASANNEG